MRQIAPKHIFKQLYMQQNPCTLWILVRFLGRFHSGITFNNFLVHFLEGDTLNEMKREILSIISRLFTRGCTAALLVAVRELREKRPR